MISRARMIFKSASTSPTNTHSQSTSVECTKKSSKSQKNTFINERCSMTSLTQSHSLLGSSALSSSVASSITSSSSSVSSLSSSGLVLTSGVSASLSNTVTSSPSSTTAHSDNEPYDLGSGINAGIHDENVWLNLDGLLRDQISEIVHKWRQIDDEIWSKIVCFERNRRIAKAYARSQVISITGSEQGFDGFRIGLNGFPNMKRDPETNRIKRQIQAGFKLKIDASGNVFVKRVGPCPIYVGGANCVGIRSEPTVQTSSSPYAASSSAALSFMPTSNFSSASTGFTGSTSEDVFMPSTHPASRFALLEPNRAQQIFDMKHYQHAVSEFCHAKRPQAMLEQLHRGCLHAIQFGIIDDKTPERILYHPCWIVLINIVALDLLWSRIGTADVPIGPHMHQRLIAISKDSDSTESNDNKKNVYSCRSLMLSSSTNLFYGNDIIENMSNDKNTHFNNKNDIVKSEVTKHSREKNVSTFDAGDTPCEQKDEIRKGVDDLYYSGYFAKISYQDQKQLQKKEKHSNVKHIKTNNIKKSSTKPIKTVTPTSLSGHYTATNSGTAAQNALYKNRRWFIWNDQSRNLSKSTEKMQQKQRQMVKKDFFSDDDDVDDEDEESINEKWRCDRRSPLQLQKSRQCSLKHQHSRHRRNSSSALLYSEGSIDSEPSHAQLSINPLQRHASCLALQHLDSSSYDEVTNTKRILQQSHHIEERFQHRKSICQVENTNSKLNLQQHKNHKLHDHHHNSQIHNSSVNLSYQSPHSYLKSLSTSLEHLNVNSVSKNLFHSYHHSYQQHRYQNQEQIIHNRTHELNNKKHLHHEQQKQKQEKSFPGSYYPCFSTNQIKKLNSNGNSSATTSDSIDSSLASSNSSLIISSSSASSSSSSLDNIPRRLPLSNQSDISKNVDSFRNNNRNKNNRNNDISLSATTSGCCRHRLYRTHAQSKAIANSKFKSNLLDRKYYSSNIELCSNFDYDESDKNKQIYKFYGKQQQQQQYQAIEGKEVSEARLGIAVNETNDNQANGVRNKDENVEEKQSQKQAFNQRLGRLLLLQQQIQLQCNVKHQKKYQDEKLHL